VFSRLDALALHVGDFTDDRPVARHCEIANLAGHSENVGAHADVMRGKPKIGWNVARLPLRRRISACK
jgi:hypothetical protein